MTRRTVVLAMVLLVAAGKYCYPANIVYSLITLASLHAQVRWETQDNCTQQILFKAPAMAEPVRRAVYPAMKGNRCEYAALIPLAQGKSTFRCGSGQGYSQEFTIKIGGPLSIFVVSNLKPGDNKSTEIVATIQEQMRSTEGQNLLVDLGARMDILGSREYFELLRPIVLLAPYQRPAMRGDKLLFVEYSCYRVELPGVFFFFARNCGLGFMQYSESRLEFREALDGKPKDAEIVVFQHEAILHEENKWIAFDLLASAYQNHSASFVISGSAEQYASQPVMSKQTHFIISGAGSSESLVSENRIRVPSSYQVLYEPSFGLLKRGAGGGLSYTQHDHQGRSISTIIHDSEKEASKESVIGIIVAVCSLALLAYFIYSWVSCYLKKPQTVDSHQVPAEETEDSSDDKEMQPIAISSST